MSFQWTEVDDDYLLALPVPPAATSFCWNIENAALEPPAAPGPPWKSSKEKWLASQTDARARGGDDDTSN